MEKVAETEKLFIIDEVQDGSRVVDSPIYEIVIFENKKPLETYKLENGPEITVLSRPETTYNEE
jgi:hypothetical protein